MVPAVAQMFADIMKETEVLFCHSVIDQVRMLKLGKVLMEHINMTKNYKSTLYPSS